MTTTSNTASQIYTVLPCSICGVKVHNPTQTHTVKSAARESTIEGRIMDVPHFGGRLHRHEVAMCETCAEHQAQADKITARFPGAERTSVKADVRLILAALDAVQLTVPLVREKSALRRLLVHLAPVSARIAYSSLVAPTITQESKAHTGTARWEHITEHRRDRIRTGYAAMLRARVETYSPVLCPSGGCLFCGVQSIPAKPSQAPNVWLEVTTTLGSLGGRRRRSQRVTGYMCPGCYQAREDVGAWGPSAIERAIFRHLNHSLGLNCPELNAPAWGALDDPEPNAQPWEHLDLDGLVERLEKTV